MVGRSSLKTKSKLYGNGAGKNMEVAVATAQKMNAVVRQKARTSPTVQIVTTKVKSLPMTSILILLYSSVLGQQNNTDSKMFSLKLHTKLRGVK